MKNPYQGLPASAFWKTGVTQSSPFKVEAIYKKKFSILPEEKIATAGSCFAQHISFRLKSNGYNVIDMEPPPPGLPQELHQTYGFSSYSARYGNIYSMRQMMQLAQEAAGIWEPVDYIWLKGNRYIDAIRPNVEPDGLRTAEEVKEQRKFHVSRVKQMFEQMDVLIFTLGLTEMWIHSGSGTVYPTAPGAIGGQYDEDSYKFQNASHSSIIHDFDLFYESVLKIRGGQHFRVIFTVSPVPLTASGSGKHVLVATNYSKAVLRSVAGQLSETRKRIDYFPSYEIVTNPRLHSSGFSENLRSVRHEVVDIVMDAFFSEHSIFATKADLGNSWSTNSTKEQIQCDEEILEAFSK